MSQLRHGLGIIRFESPDLAHPIAFKFGVDPRKTIREFIHQLIGAQVKMRMPRLEIITRIDDMIPAKMLRSNIIGMLHQGQKGESISFWQIEPIIALLRKLMF